MMQRMAVAAKEAIWVMLTALVLAGGAYALRPGVLHKGAGATGAEADIQDNMISIEAAAEHFRQGTAVFADARPEKHFLAGHIEGALNLDPDLFDAWSEAVFSQIPADAVIITYCDGARCTLSLDLSEKLTWLGYEKVFHLENGWGRWKESGLPND